MAESRWGRLGAVSGIVFAVLFTLGVMLPDLPGNSEADGVAIEEFYAESGDRVMVIVGMYMLMLAGIAFLGFVVNLYRGLRQAEGDKGVLATLALAAGVLFVATLYSSSSAWAAVPGGIEFGGAAQPTSDVSLWLAQLGYVDLLIHGMFAAIVVIVTTSLVALRTAVLPRWLAWTGFGCAALLVFALVYIPMIALPIWAIATSVAMLRRPVLRTERATRAVPTAA
jgi:hypothetical protein